MLSRPPALCPRNRRLRSWVPRGRRLHVIDIENLIGDPYASPEIIRAAIENYRAVARVKDIDHVKVGCNPFMAARDITLWEDMQLRVGHGLNGADDALLRGLHARELASRYETVFIGSGDGVFAPLATRLAHRDVTVIVVSRPKALSFALRSAAGRAVRFPWSLN